MEFQKCDVNEKKKEKKERQNEQRKTNKVVKVIKKKQRHYFANRGLSNQGYGFSCGHVWM